MILVVCIGSGGSGCVLKKSMDELVGGTDGSRRLRWMGYAGWTLIMASGTKIDTWWFVVPYQLQPLAGGSTEERRKCATGSEATAHKTMVGVLAWWWAIGARTDHQNSIGNLAPPLGLLMYCWTVSSPAGQPELGLECRIRFWFHWNGYRCRIGTSIDNTCHIICSWCTAG